MQLWSRAGLVQCARVRMHACTHARTHARTHRQLPSSLLGRRLPQELSQQQAIHAPSPCSVWRRLPVFARK